MSVNVINIFLSYSFTTVKQNIAWHVLNLFAAPICQTEEISTFKSIQSSSVYTNTAYHFPAYSIYKCCTPEYATDGNTASFLNTDDEVEPFFLLDLEKGVFIHKIKITNRIDMLGKYILNSSVNDKKKWLSIVLFYFLRDETKRIHLLS